MCEVLVKLVPFCASGGVCLARVMGVAGWCIEVVDTFGSS